LASNPSSANCKAAFLADVSTVPPSRAAEMAASRDALRVVMSTGTVGSGGTGGTIGTGGLGKAGLPSMHEMFHPM